MYSGKDEDERSTMRSRHRGLVAVMTSLAFLTFAAPAPADKGGIPHGSPDTCGVGKAEAHDFTADPTLPGVSEIKTYPPVAFGCTGHP
jgi:hypothetical protein